MKYYEIKIEVSELGIEPMLAALICEGVDTAEVNDPADALFMNDQLGETDYLAPEDFKRESSKSPSIVVYAADDMTADSTINAVKKAAKTVRENAEKGLFGTVTDLGTLKVTVNIRGDEEWKDRWKEFLKPAALGYSFVATPPWIDMSEYDCEFDDREVIRINPGMAFGTGLHETTSLSADFLETYIHEGDKVLDVGCGTGILSILASKLGASEVLGIDIDDEAVAASIENNEANDVHNVVIKKADLTEGVDFKADIVVANLLTNLVVRLTGDIRNHLDSGGRYIMSGILTTQQNKVIAALKENGFVMLAVAKLGEWCAIAAELI